MPTSVIRPDSNIANGGTIIGGSPSAAAAFSDNNDGTYIIQFGGAQSRGHFSDIGALASNQRILRARIRARMRQYNAGFFTDTYVALRDAAGNWFTSMYHQNAGANWTEHSSAWTESGPSGEWTVGDVNALQYIIQDNGGGGTSSEISEVYADIEIRTRPTVSGVGPSGTNPGTTRRPTVSWTFSDPDGLQGQSAYRVKIFTAAQGDPENAAAYWDSGYRGGSNPSQTIEVDLPDGTYYVYVTAAKDFRGSNWYSTWGGGNSFTITDTPALPTSVIPVAGGTITTSTPTMGATVNASALSTPARIEWQWATDTAFTLNLRTIIEAAGDARVSGATTEAWPGTVTRLTQGTWYLRARAIDNSGKLGPWTTTSTIIVSHPPAPSNFSPTGNVTLNYGASGTVRFDWDFTDPDGANDYQTAFQVEVTRVDTGAVIVDTGKVVSTDTFRDYAHATSLKDVGLRWRVRLYDRDDVLGTYSGYQLYKVADAPAVTITSPTENGTIDNPRPNVTWTTVLTGGRTQSNYRVRFWRSTEAQTATPLYDSTWLSGANLAHQPPTNILANNTSYQVRVDVRDNTGLENSDTNIFTVTYTAPPEVPFTINADMYDQAGYVAIQWTDATRDAQWTEYRVYRRVIGETAWTLVTRTTTVSTTYRIGDYLAPSETGVEYAVTQYGTRYGVSIESPKPGETGAVQPRRSATPSSDSYWLIDITNGVVVKLEIVTSDDFNEDYEQATLDLIGRGRKVDYGSRLGYTGSLSAQLRDSDAWPKTAREQRLDIQRIVAGRGEVWLRNPFGDVWQVALGQISFGRVAGVGHREFLDVTIPYTEVS